MTQVTNLLMDACIAQPLILSQLVKVSIFIFKRIGSLGSRCIKNQLAAPVSFVQIRICRNGLDRIARLYDFLLLAGSSCCNACVTQGRDDQEVCQPNDMNAFRFSNKVPIEPRMAQVSKYLEFAFKSRDQDVATLNQPANLWVLFESLNALITTYIDGLMHANKTAIPQGIINRCF